MKKKIRYYHFLLILSVSLFSCDSKEDDGAVKIKDGIIDINVLRAAKDVRDFSLSALVEDIEIIELESTPESYFVNAKSLKITNRHILIACGDQRKVFLFDRSGKFLRVIGGHGNGPGEYLYPWYATLDPAEENVLVIDIMLNRLFIYSIDGILIDQKNIGEECQQSPNGQPIFLDRTHFAFPVVRPHNRIDDYYSIYVYDLELNITEKLIPRPNNEELNLFGLFHRTLDNGDEGPYYWEKFTDTLYYLSPNEDPKPAYHYTIDENYETIELLKDPQSWQEGERRNFVGGVTDIPRYLLAWAFVNKSIAIVYDKKKQDAFCVVDPHECDSISEKTWMVHSIENDVFGLGPVEISKYHPEENVLSHWINLDKVTQTNDFECIENKDVTNPDLRAKILKMAMNYNGEELPVLVLMHLK